MATYIGKRLKFTDADGDEYIVESESYESKSAQAGGVDVSLVTTGEKAIWNGKTSNEGTVKKIETGVGLTGGPFTVSGTISADLVSEQFAENASESPSDVSGRQYPVVPDSNGKLSVNVPWESSTQDTTYTLSQDPIDGHRITLTPSEGTSTTITIPDNDTTYDNLPASENGTAHSLVTTGEKYLWNAKAETGDIPVNVSELRNDIGYLTQHQDISGKADKVAGATSGNFAALDSDGNLINSGHRHSDYLTSHQDISGKLDVSQKGTANGVAELDASGKVPSTQLPSYVDDVMEYANMSSFPLTGESGKIYVAVDENKTYRWSGSTYVEIGGGGVALGETSATAYRGDRGKIAYDHAMAKGSANTIGLYKIATNSEGHVTDADLVTKQDIVDLGIPATNTNTTYSLSQDSLDGHVLTFTPSSGSPTTITIPDSDTDVRNTAGATDTSSKIYLIGATSQSDNPQTYSHDTAYVGTDGCLYSGGKKVLTAHQDISGKKNTQTAVSDPTAAGTATSFIKTISQNEQGVITPTKASLPTASTTVAGIVQLNDALTSTSTTQALTASQGKALNDSISNAQDGLAIVADGNTHVAIASGQFVYVKNHSSLAEGLYKATAAISANGALSTSNLTADGHGGLNDLQSQITSLNSNLTSNSVTLSYKNNWKNNGISKLFRSGNVATLNLTARDGTMTTGTVIAEFNAAYAPIEDIYAPAIITGGGYCWLLITKSGQIRLADTITNASMISSCSWCF